MPDPMQNPDTARERLESLLKQRVSTGGQSALPEGQLIPICEVGTRTPLICVVGGVAGVTVYRQLGQFLPDRPIYALRLHVPANQAGTFATIESIAAAYASLVRSGLPRGFYYLCGHSFGATIAYELSHRLQEAGYGLAGLFLIDQPGPDVRLTVRDWIYWQWAAVCHLPWRLRWPYLVDGLRYRLRTVAWLPSGLRRCFYSNEWKNTEPGQRLSANEYRRRTTDAGIHALRNYRPLACDFPCVLVRAKSGAPRIHADPYGGWGTVTDRRVRVFDLEGTHMTMFQPESLAALAAIFRECMDGDDSRRIKVSVGV